MAGQAAPDENKELISAPPDRETVREHAAKLYGQGYERRVIARILLNHLVPNGLHRPEDVRMRQARQRLRDWEHQQTFRDLVYASAVVKLDMSTPAILKGVASKAKRGRVDAARLALELTGRHNPKGDQTPAQVAVIISGVPRPVVKQQAPDGQVIIEANEAMIAEDQDV
jgi:hypothetical protein